MNEYWNLNQWKPMVAAIRDQKFQNDTAILALADELDEHYGDQLPRSRLIRESLKLEQMTEGLIPVLDSVHVREFTIHPDDEGDGFRLTSRRRQVPFVRSGRYGGNQRITIISEFNPGISDGDLFIFVQQHDSSKLEALLRVLDVSLDDRSNYWIFEVELLEDNMGRIVAHQRREHAEVLVKSLIEEVEKDHPFFQIKIGSGIYDKAISPLKLTWKRGFVDTISIDTNRWEADDNAEYIATLEPVRLVVFTNRLPRRLEEITPPKVNYLRYFQYHRMKDGKLISVPGDTIDDCLNNAFGTKGIHYTSAAHTLDIAEWMKMDNSILSVARDRLRRWPNIQPTLPPYSPQEPQVQQPVLEEDDNDADDSDIDSDIEE